MSEFEETTPVISDNQEELPVDESNQEERIAYLRSKGIEIDIPGEKREVSENSADMIMIR